MRKHHYFRICEFICNHAGIFFIFILAHVFCFVSLFSSYGSLAIHFILCPKWIECGKNSSVIMTFSVHRRSLCTCSITVHFLCNWCLTQTSSHSEEIECISQLFNTFTFAHFQCYFCRVNTLKIRGIYSIEWTKSESKFFRTAKSAKNQKNWQTIRCNVITDGQHHMWNIKRPEENSTSIIEFPVVRNKPK